MLTQSICLILPLRAQSNKTIVTFDFEVKIKIYPSIFLRTRLSTRLSQSLCLQVATYFLRKIDFSTIVVIPSELGFHAVVPNHCFGPQVLPKCCVFWPTNGCSARCTLVEINFFNAKTTFWVLLSHKMYCLFCSVSDGKSFF